MILRAPSLQFSSVVLASYTLCAIAGLTGLLAGSSIASAQVPPGAVADLSVQARLFGSIRAGGNLRLEVGVSNAGPAIAEAIVLDTFLPAQVESTGMSGVPQSTACNVVTEGNASRIRCSGPRLVPAYGMAVIVYFRIRPQFGPGSEFEVTASVVAATPDPVTADNVLRLRRLVQDGTERADLVASVVDPPTTTPAGAVTTFRVRARNAGPATAGLTTASVLFPRSAATSSIAAPEGWSCVRAYFPPIAIAPPTLDAFECEIFRFDPGSVDFLLTLQGSSATLPYEVGLRLDSVTDDPDVTNDFASFVVNAGNMADIGIAVSDSPDPVSAGGLLTHSAIITNFGPTIADAVSVRIDSSLSLESTSIQTSPGWVCELLVPPPVFPSPPATYLCRASQVPVGASTLTMTSTVVAGSTAPVNVFFTAGGSSADPVAANNAAGATTAIGVGAPRGVPVLSPMMLALLALALAMLGRRSTVRAR